MNALIMWIPKVSVWLSVISQRERLLVFLQGANLVDVVTAAKEDRIDDIRQLIRLMQTAVQRFRYEAFPVVAAPYGTDFGRGV